MRGLGIIICGPPGVGKSTFAYEWPKPLSNISLFETAYDDFEPLGLVPQGCQNINITDYPSLLTFVEKSTQKTLVIDGLRGFQQIYFNQLTKTHFDNSSSKFNAFYTGPRRVAVDELIHFLALLNLKLQKGTHLVLLSHTKIINEDNVSGEDYKKADLDMDTGIAESFKAWTPNILYMAPEPASIQSGKASSSAPARLLYTSLSFQHCAKNKLNLPRFIPCGNSPKEAFTNFWSHVPPLYKG